MNQSFDLNRWWLLVGKHWSENRKKYTLSLIAIAGLLLVWFSFVLFIDGGRRPIQVGLQAVTYFWGLVVVGCLYASLFFADLSSKSKGINYLSVPASHLEKLACALFYVVIAFFVCYTAIFYLFDIIMVKISNTTAFHYWLQRHPNDTNFRPEEVINIFAMPAKRANSGPNIFFYLLLAYITLQGAFILGSIYFPKFSFIKTTIALILIALFFVFFVAKIIPSFMPEGNYYKSITSYQFHTGNTAQWKIVILPEWSNAFLEFLLKYALAPILWLATYFRLKEKEI